MKTGPFKMKGKSPMMKALIGKQNNLPAELKAKIEAAPESPAMMKKESSMKMMKKSPAKKIDILNVVESDRKDRTDARKPKRSYAEAYKKRDMKTYGNLSQEEYTKEAKRQTSNKKSTTVKPTYSSKGKKGSFDAPKSQMKGSVTGPKTKDGTKDTKLPSTKKNIVITKNKTKTDANDARVAKENKVKSDKIKSERATPKTKKRTKVGKLATKIANKFRKNKKDPNRVDIKKSAAKMKKKSSMKMMKKK